jgi:hypothetical protein
VRSFNNLFDVIDMKASIKQTGIHANNIPLIEAEIASLHRLLDKLAPNTIGEGDLIGDRIEKLLSSDADWDKIK